MKKIYLYEYEDFQCMLDENVKWLDGWVAYDANWRSEYFDWFMKKIGINVKRLPKKYEKRARKEVIDNYGDIF